MSETRGIFGLTEAVDQKLDNEWVPLDQVFGVSNFTDLIIHLIFNKPTDGYLVC